MLSGGGEPLFDGSRGSSNDGGSGGSVSESIRTGFGHINDLFSQFSKHISPSYHHERPERSVQMRLYVMHKGQYLLITIMFLCLFFIALLMGMAGPRIITEHKEYATLLPKQPQQNESLAVVPYNILTPLLTVYRQQLWLTVEIKLGESDQQGTFAKPFKVMLLTHGLASSSASSSDVLLSNVTRIRIVRCSADTCDSLVLLHVGSLHYPRYAFCLTFSGLESLDKHFKITDIVFTMTTYNPEFTRMEIWFRFFFLVVTFSILVAFVICMRNYSLEDWAIEQKWAVLLLLLLAGYNNPFFSLCILTSLEVPAVADVLLQASFIFSLLLYWLCIFHGLRQTERGTLSFYLPKITLVGSMWLSVAGIAYFEKKYELRDPSFSYQSKTAHHHSFQLTFMTLLGCYVTYLLYLSLRAFGELRAMNFIESRLKFHSGTLVLVFSLLLSIMANRYGRGVLEDNFIAKIYTSYQSEYHFLAFYTVLNCYVYVLAYMYAPTSAQARATSQHLLRDNPAFSMLNESDEEREDGGVGTTALAVNGGSLRILHEDEDDDDENVEGQSETDALMRLSSPSPPTATRDSGIGIVAKASKPPSVIHWLGHDDDSD